jgi:hypothetical protein
MSTPQQWELGGEIVEKGLEHAAFRPVLDSWNDVLVRLEEVRKTSAGLKKVGVGRTEDPTLVVARLVPALREVADEIAAVTRQLEARLGGA